MLSILHTTYSLQFQFPFQFLFFFPFLFPLSLSLFACQQSILSRALSHLTFTTNRSNIKSSHQIESNQITPSLFKLNQPRNNHTIIQWVVAVITKALAIAIVFDTIIRRLHLLSCTSNSLRSTPLRRRMVSIPSNIESSQFDMSSLVTIHEAPSPNLSCP